MRQTHIIHIAGEIYEANEIRQPIKT